LREIGDEVAPPRSSVTMILAILVGRSVVSAIIQTPPSTPAALVTTPPRSSLPMLTVLARRSTVPARCIGLPQIPTWASVAPRTALPDPAIRKTASASWIRPKTFFVERDIRGTSSRALNQQLRLAGDRLPFLRSCLSLRRREQPLESRKRGTATVHSPVPALGTPELRAAAVVELL
jgi:hypothetical protein